MKAVHRLSPVDRVIRQSRAVLLLSAAGFAASFANAEEQQQQQQQQQPLRANMPFVAKESGGSAYVAQVLQNTSDLLALELSSLTDLGVVLVIFALAAISIFAIPNVVDESLVRFRVSGHVRTATRTLLQIAIAYSGIRLALGAIGVDSNGIAANLGLLGVAWSIGAAAPIANATAGLCRTGEELQPGHRISIHQYTGEVVELGFFNVRVRNEANGRIVVIPNNDFLQAAWEHDIAPSPPTPAYETGIDVIDAKNARRFTQGKK